VCEREKKHQHAKRWKITNGVKMVTGEK